MNSVLKKYVIMTMMSLLYPMFTFAYDFEVDNIYYNILSQSDLTCEVTSNPNIYDGSIEIPAYVNNGNYRYKVTAIGDNAFNEREYKVSQLMDITLPNTIEKIGVNSFYCCGGLKSIEIPNSVKFIENNAFAECLNLLSVEIPNSVVKIGAWSFKNCWSLKNVTILSGNEILEMHNNAFSGSGYELNLFIGRSVKDGMIGNVSPVKINIAEGIDIDKLFESNNIPKELRILKMGKNIIGFPRDLTDFTKLVIFQIQDEIPPECPLFTETQYSSIKLIVPDGAINSYKEAKGWKNFYDIEESSNTNNHDIFLIGSMSYWLPSDEWKFTPYDKDATIYKFIASVPQRIDYSDEFKIATEDWTAINYGVDNGHPRIETDTYTKLVSSENSSNCQLASDWYGVCWLDIKSSIIIFSNDKNYFPDFTTDGVEETSEKYNLKESVYYNLQGIKNNSTIHTPGIYIIKNNKKYKKIFIK